MSNAGRSCPPVARVCAPNSSLKSPAPRRTRALLLGAAAVLWACVDAPLSPPDARPEADPAEMRLASMARSLTSAMNSAGVRLDVLADMRASPRVDHSLILGDHLSEPRARELLDRSADALGVTGPEFVALVRGIGELEFLVPVTRDRLTWAGSSRVAVASHWNSDGPWGNPSTLVDRVVMRKDLDSFTTRVPFQEVCALTSTGGRSTKRTTVDDPDEGR